MGMALKDTNMNNEFHYFFKRLKHYESFIEHMEPLIES